MAAISSALTVTVVRSQKTAIITGGNNKVSCCFFFFTESHDIKQLEIRLADIAGKLRKGPQDYLANMFY